MTPEMKKELTDWLRQKPPCVRELCLKFPPGSLIRAEGYSIPSVFVDCLGWVVSYFEDNTMSVVDSWPLNFGIRGQIDCDRATLVSADVVTVEEVREILDQLKAEAS